MFLDEASPVLSGGRVPVILTDPCKFFSFFRLRHIAAARGMDVRMAGKTEKKKQMVFFTASASLSYLEVLY